ncbi:MAG: hypothetical protein ACFCUQ_12815 [Kiloniellales bacterium]
MALQDAPAANGNASLPQTTPAAATAAVTPRAQELPPPASLATVPLRRQRQRPVTPPDESRPERAAVPASARATPDRSECKSAAQAAPKETTPEPAARAESHQSAEVDPAETSGGDIVAFWKGLRGERRFPSWTDLRFERCALHWPNSLLLRFPADDGSALPRIEASFSEAMRAAPLRDAGRSRIDHTPLMTDWLIALSQEAARAGRPISDEQVLPSWRGPTRYRAVALPFSEDQAEIDHVLCHVAHA